MLTTSRLFIFGLGYVGRQVAYEALKQGVWHVSGSCRSPEKAVALRVAGVETYAFDLDDAYTGLEPAGLEALAAATHLLVTVPPVADLDRDPLLALHMQQARCCTKLSSRPAHALGRSTPPAQLLATPHLRFGRTAGLIRASAAVGRLPLDDQRVRRSRRRLGGRVRGNEGRRARGATAACRAGAVQPTP